MHIVTRLGIDFKIDCKNTGMNSYSKIIECYEPKNIYIYNVDDTGLFCMLPPNKTGSLKGDLAVVERIPRRE